MKAIIIGAGLAGLSMAAELSVKGHNVTVYEQNPFIGGIMSHAKKNGYEWEQGPLMLTGFEEDGICYNILRNLDVKYETVLCDRGSVFRDFELWKPKHYQGPRWRKNKLLEIFPDESVGLDKYYKFYDRMVTIYDIQDKLEQKNSFLYKLLLIFNFLRIKKYASLNAQQLMDLFFKDDKLKTVFTAILADLCIKPSEFSCLGIPSLNIEQAFDKRIPQRKGFLKHQYFSYIIGGTERITEGLGNTIKNRGSKIYTNTEVVKVIVENNKAIGVELKDGSVDKADIVIASAGAKELFNKMVGRDNLTKDFLNILDDILPMEAVFMVHLGLDIDPLQYQKSELCYYYLTYDIDDAVSQMRNGIYHEGEQGFLIYVPSSHGKNMAPEGKHSVTIYTVAPDRLNDSDWESKKDYYADKLISLAEKYIPELSKHITEKLILTADDYRKLTHLDRNSFGGLVPHISKKSIPHVTPVNALYFIGAQSQSQGGVSSQIRASHKLAKKIIDDNK
ncbi:MAG: NAD(P)/FAD-dependent oxidoreductase [Clostridia bacterium]|nr:NAD(P)/FAD-dependent oxidoreductase [Clostridia bacterium]